MVFGKCEIFVGGPQLIFNQVNLGAVASVKCHFPLFFFFNIACNIHKHTVVLMCIYMSQFPQDGEDGQNVAFFHNFWSSAVSKRFDRFNFSQLF